MQTIKLLKMAYFCGFIMEARVGIVFTGISDSLNLNTFTERSDRSERSDWTPNARNCREFLVTQAEKDAAFEGRRRRFDNTTISSWNSSSIRCSIISTAIRGVKRIGNPD
jgi:hypothetical protein